MSRVRRMHRGLGILVLASALTACGAANDPGPTTPAPAEGAPGSSSAPAGDGWRVTVYYTPVEEFHDGEPTPVRGRPDLESEEQADLGSFRSGFVDTVREEGGGRIFDGPHAGMYLNWSRDIGFWLDSSTRDTAGRPLVPFETAAVDGIARGTPLRPVTCGVDDDGSPAAAEPCDRFRAAEWMVRDEFTPGLGGERHADLYIGEETGPGFTASELWVARQDAEVAVGPEA